MGEGMGRRRTTHIALIALLGFLAGGCRTLGVVLPGAGSGPSAEVPADAPPELHFLVGRDLELDGDLDGALEAYERALALDPDSPELLRKVAELSARRNRLDSAVRYGERALALDPEDIGTRHFLGTLYRFLRDPERAREVLTDEAGDPLDGDAALLLYGALSDAGRHDEAAQVARWLIEDEPEGLRGYLALADSREKRDDLPGAEAALREGLARNPGELSMYGALARARRDRGDREGEVEIYREILEFEPEHHVTQLALAEALLRLERVDEAIVVLEDVERAHPEDLRSTLRLAFLYFERREWSEALRRFERALEVNPGQHEVTYFLGVTLRRSGDEEAAMEAFSKIPPGHERYPESLTQIAAMYEERGEYELALENVDRARAQGEARPLDLYAASLRSKAGDFDGALAFLESLLDEAPEDAELLYNIGVLHGETGRADRAVEYMELALEKQPDHAGALNFIGYTWAESGTNLDRAEEYITRALEIRPDDGYITDSLGWVYYMRARPLIAEGRRDDALLHLDRALRELERAAELTGGDPVISEHLGDVYLLLEDKEGALRQYEEALGLDPRAGEQPQLGEKVERLRKELGR
jgi:tetratricopeptide (TPR) repeat protein